MGAAAGPIRLATPEDVPVLLTLIRELAEYEREPDAVAATEGLLHRALFEQQACNAHVVEIESAVVGFALWYPTFSTWTGRQGLWLEDLYVRPDARGRGLGRALLSTLAGICLDRGWSRFEWWVLDWNTPAQAVYRSVGAVPQDDWTVWRVDGDALASLAGSALP